MTVSKQSQDSDSAWKRSSKTCMKLTSAKCRRRHHHHHHLSVMELGHLLTHSGLTCKDFIIIIIITVKPA